MSRPVTHAGAPFRLVTLRGCSLIGPAGPIPLDDPRHAALLVRLAMAPTRSASGDELLLDIWPHLTVKQGMDQLRAATAAIASAADAALVAESEGHWSLDPAVETDLERAGPGRAATFAIDLRLPDTPEWDAWVRSARQSLANRPLASRPRRVRWLLATAVVIAVGFGVLAARPRPVAGFTAGDPIILADVENRTADTTLGRTLQTAALVGLERSTRVDLFPLARVSELYRARGKTLRAGRLERDVALEAATEAGVPWVVTVLVEPVGDRTRVTIALIRVANGAVALRTSETADLGIELVGAVDRTLRTLQRRLGESADALASQPPLAFATTADLAALRAYTDGQISWRAGEYDLAEDYWERALTLDTGFVMAMGSLGKLHYYQHNRVLGERYYRQALDRASRLTEWERLQLADGYASARGKLDSSIIWSQMIASKFPRAATFYDLGTSLLQARRCPEAIAALTRASQLDPTHAPTHVNLATCHARLGHHEAARRAYSEAGRRDTTILFDNNINLEYTKTLLHAGRGVEAESALVRMTRRPTMSNQAMGFRGLGYLALWRGEVASAEASFRRAVELMRQQRAPTSLLRNLVLLAAANRAAGDETELARSLAQVDSLTAIPTIAPGFLALAIAPHAELGHTRDVRTLVERIRARAVAGNPADSNLVGYGSAALALLERDARRALALLEGLDDQLYPQRLAVLRAGAHRALGQLDSAAAILRGVAATSPFGYEDQMAWTRALIELGEVQELLGQTDAASASYARFLDQWKRADPGLPDVVWVRARLDALERGRRVADRQR